MPLIAEAFKGRVEMLNAIFGGGGDKTRPTAPPAPRGQKRRLAATGTDVGTGLRALAALGRKRGVDGNG